MKAVEDILKNSLFYPACGEDGLPVKSFNEHFTEYGIDSYVYIDYAMNADRLKSIQNGFRYYHVVEEKELEENDLVVSGTDYMQYAAILTPEEIAKLEETVYERYVDTIKPFGRMIEYERNDDADPSRGPESFTLLYIGAEAVAAYAALYRTRGIAPKAIAIIAPGTGFGGNYTDFYDPDSALLKLVRQGESQPEYIMFGYGKVMRFDEYLEENTQINNNMNSVLQLPYLENELSAEVILKNTPRKFVLKQKRNKQNEKETLETHIAKSHSEYKNILFELQQKKELYRDYISSLYTEKPFHEAVFATLIWGGLNRANLNRFLEENIESINTKIQDVKTKLCDELDIESAYKSMLQGKQNHINGIGIAFFTKILYFLAADIDGMKPLIFDKWTQTIHAVSLPEDGAKWYVLSKTEKGTYNAPQFKSDSIKTEAYLDFIAKMHNLSKQIGVPSDLIEEYLFGCSKKFSPTEWNENNPRKKLVDYVINRPSCRIVTSDTNQGTSSKTKRQGKPQNSAIAESEIKGADAVVSELQERYQGYQFHKNEKLTTKRKAIISCEISDGLTLAIGENHRHIYCGIYAKSPDTILPYEMLFDNHTDSKSYKGQYNNYQKDQVDQAIKQFSAILDLEIAKKSNQ